MMKNNNKGQAIIAVVFFTFLLASYAVIGSMNILRSARVERNEESAVKSRVIAQSGIEKAIWCINYEEDSACGGVSGTAYSGETDIAIGAGTFSTTITNLSPSQKLVSASGYLAGQEVQINQILEPSATLIPVTLSSGIVGGDEGVEIGKDVELFADIHSNGDIECGDVVIPYDVSISGTSMLESCEVAGSAWAYHIKDSDIDEDAYYNTIESSSVGGSSYSGESPIDAYPQPISDSDIDSWKSDAGSATVHSGNYSLSSDGSLGPIEITGNLDISNGTILTLTGVVYVHGDITFNNSAEVHLAEAFGSNSGTIIADQKIEMKNSFVAESNSFGGLVVFISTDTSDPTIVFKNSAGEGDAVVLFAPNGGVEFKSSSEAYQVSASSILLKNNSAITYAGGVSSFSVMSDSSEEIYWQVLPGSRNE
jgi:hypothetical protein